MQFDFETLTADPDRLRAGLEAADPATLLLVLVQLTGDASWLHEARPFVRGPFNYQEEMPDELRGRIREALFKTVNDFAATGREVPAIPDGQLLRDMMSFAAADELSDDYAAMMREDLNADIRDPGKFEWRTEPPRERVEDFQVVIIGAGVSGIYMAIRLLEAGIKFTILEKNETVGGTWLENRYPGCGVDTPNHFYSFAFAPNHEWSEYFAKREELWRYLEDMAERFDLKQYIRFGVEVDEARFDDETAQWRLTTTGGEVVEGDVLVSAVGILNRPKMPQIEGLESFAGPSFHTARWDESFDWHGKRIAMIGTGASGQQVGPAIADDVDRLMVFQRSPHWVVPNPNYHADVADGKKWILKHLPYYLRWYRFQLFWGFADGLHAALEIDPEWSDPEHSLNQVNARHRHFMERHIRREIGDDPELLAKVIPDYPPYGKRILIDNHWFRTLTRDNVDLITDDIARIVPEGVETTDGTVWEADALVLATGFEASKMLSPMKVYGRGGQEIHDVWGPNDARAYLGITAPGFPNFFMMNGPNTALAHGGNQIFMAECMVWYTMQAIRELIEGGHQTLDCRQDVHDRYNEIVDERHGRMVWTHPGMTNWYRNEAGRVFAVSPWRLVDYWRLTKEFQPEEYLVA